MEATSMTKLMDAGYVFIRRDDRPRIRIKYRKKGSGDWKTMENFPTKAAHDRRVKELLKDKFIIMDA